MNSRNTKLLKWANFARQQVKKRSEIADTFNKSKTKRPPVLLSFRMMSVFTKSNIYKDGDYVEEKKYEIEIVDGIDFKASKYFDIRSNNWKLDKLVPSVLQATKLCKTINNLES